MILYINIFLMQYTMDFKGEDVYFKTKYILNGTDLQVETTLCNEPDQYCYGFEEYDFNAYNNYTHGSVRT